MSVHACESVGDNSRFLVIFFLREREREREREFLCMAFVRFVNTAFLGL